MFTRKPMILCADDEPLNLKVLGALLDAHGYDHVFAADGVEAIAKIESGGIDLALLDVMMPKMDGFEVCRRIKTDERWRNIPVVMLTALSATSDRIRGIESGAEDFISKPFDQAEVLARVRMLLKIKFLNDQLNSAYAKITGLLGFGEQSIRSFDPITFDLNSQIEQVVRQIIKTDREALDRPQFVFIGTMNETGVWQWVQYEFVFGNLNSAKIGLNLFRGIRLPPKKASETIFLNSPDFAGSALEPLIAALGSLSVTPANIVCYLSSALSVLCVNYGREVTAYDAAVLNSMVVQSLFLKSLSNQVRETESAFEYTVHALARAAEANDEDTGNHILRVGNYSAVIAEGLGMKKDFVEAVRLQATLHDVGKVHIRPDILRKPGRLTPEEWAEMKTHTIQGAKIVGEHPRLITAQRIAISHHERWDGSGYPYGLKAEAIPIEGRIVNIADQYDALRNRRSYKPAFDHQTTYKIIVNGDGRTMPGHFDPAVLDAFIRHHRKLEDIYETMRESV